jgi:type I restriction enzyme R subunit
MENLTLVFLTDRNDLDDQLFGEFLRRQRNPAANTRASRLGRNLRKLLNVASGGVVFTAIQKFMPEEKGGKAPELSKRRNIIVIADEAHRGQRFGALQFKTFCLTAPHSAPGASTGRKAGSNSAESRD